MSEFTDYVQFPSDAQSVEALQGQSVQAVGATGLGILKDDDGQAFSTLVGATCTQMTNLSFPYRALDPGEVRLFEED